MPVAAPTVVLTDTSDDAAFTVQTQTTNPAVLPGLTSAERETGWTRTHSCPVDAGLLGEGLGLGFGVLVGVGDGDGLGLALSVPLLDVDGDGLGEVLDGDGELDPVALGLAESLGDALVLELLEDELALADFVPETVGLGECDSSTLAVVSSAAPIVWLVTAAVVFAAVEFFSE
jgi:hypothetical protein